MYEDYCLSNNNNNSTMTMTSSSLSNTKGPFHQMCMCNVLKDIVGPDATIQSVRPTSSSIGKSSSSRGNGIECINGKVITPSGLEYECSNINLLSFVSSLELNATDDSFFNDVGPLSSLWGWYSDDIEIALVAAYSGITFVDITVPTNPVVIGKVSVSSNGSPTLWHDVRVYKDHAYMISESGNMQYINMTTVVNAYKANGGNFSLTPYAKEFGNTTLQNTHTIEINIDTGYAYLVGTNLCSSGMYMIDIRNPSEPKDAGCFSDVGYVHEVQCIVYNGPDVRYTNKEICFACIGYAVAIVDVSNKEEPVLLSLTSYTGNVFTHQGVVTNDQQYFIFGDEYDEIGGKTFVFNVMSLTIPYIVGYHLSTLSATDHNQYIKGNYAYQANYRSGLRVLYLTDVPQAQLTEVAYFDTFPEGNEIELNGAWNVYPFFPSGSIIVSNIETGLFVLQLNTSVVIPTLNDPRSIATLGTCDTSNKRRCKARNNLSQFFGRFMGRFMGGSSVYIPMYRYPVRQGGILCRERCIEESEMPNMIDLDWKCGVCP